MGLWLYLERAHGPSSYSCDLQPGDFNAASKYSVHLQLTSRGRTLSTMSSKVMSVTSPQHFRTITSSSTYTVVDFYADVSSRANSPTGPPLQRLTLDQWCGPCKVISPIFEQLAAAESKPGRIVFAKVNVDNQRDVASTYGVSA